MILFFIKENNLILIEGKTLFPGGPKGSQVVPRGPKWTPDLQSGVRDHQSGAKFRSGAIRMGPGVQN